MALIPGLVSAGSGLVGGLVDLFSGQSAERQRQQADAETIKALQNMARLDPEDYVADYQDINLADLEFAEAPTEESIQLGDTAMAGIQLDPSYKQAQMEALAALQRRGEQGLTLEEEAARNEIVGAAGIANRGAQEAIMQQAARQGRLSGGDALAAQLATAGQSYDSAARQAAELAASRENRALQAALGAGEFAGNVRSQEFGEQSDVARAKDAIASFNARMKEGQQQRNVDRQYGAAQQKAAGRTQAKLQNLAQRNTQADQQVQGRIGSNAQQRQMQASIADVKSGAGQRAADRTAAQGASIGNMISGLGSTAADLYTDYNKKKKDDEEI
jgi:hypothetical protein